MGFRDSINQRPRLVTGLTVAVIVLSLVAIVLQQRALPTRNRIDGPPPSPHESPVGEDVPQAPDEHRRPATAGTALIAARADAAAAPQHHAAHSTRPQENAE